MAKTATKTKPIGVRFDLEVLRLLSEKEIADSPQRALNFLSSFWVKSGATVEVVPPASESIEEPKSESVPEQKVEEPPVTEVPEPPKTERNWIRNEPKKKKEIPPPTQQMRESLVFAQEIHEAKTIEQLDVIEKEVNNAIAKNRFSPIEKEVVKRVLREKRDRIGK